MVEKELEKDSSSQKDNFFLKSIKIQPLLIQGWLYCIDT